MDSASDSACLAPSTITSSGRSVRLPEQHAVERLGGGGEAGKAQAAALPRLQAPHQLLKRRVPPQALEQIADRRMSQGGCARVGSLPRFRWSNSRVRAASASTLPPAASTSSRPAMKCAQSAPLIRMSGSTAAISSRGVSSSNSVTASTASSASASVHALLLRDQRARGTFQPPHARVGVQRQNQHVAHRARLFQQPDVTRMQDVVAAVGEDDLLALAASNRRGRPPALRVCRS